MRWHMIVVSLSCFIILAGLPALATADWKEGLTAEWPAEDLHAWGDSNLAVDFGTNGLWNYNGSWIQLSQWDAERMEVMDTHRLSVDFGPRGLWIYDGRMWIKITR